MGRMLNILHRVNSAYLTAEDIQRQVGRMIVEPGDFDGPLDVVPVSDPHIFSETQRFAQMQAILQRQQAAPGLYDVRKTEEMFLRQMKVKPDDVLVALPGKQDTPALEENVAATMGQPIVVLPQQDHAAHIKTHLAFMQSPMFGMNPVMMRALLPLMVIHLRDHLLNYYMTQAKEGLRLAKGTGKMPEDNEMVEVEVIVRVQQVIEQEFGQMIQLLGQMDEHAKKMAAEQSQGAQDPSLQIAQMNSELQQSIQQMRSQMEQMKLQAGNEKAQAELQFKQMKLQIDTQIEQAKLQQRMAETQAKLQQDTQISREEMEAKEAMNSSDNQTALVITEANIAAGKRSNLKTGSGINP